MPAYQYFNVGSNLNVIPALKRNYKRNVNFMLKK